MLDGMSFNKALQGMRPVLGKIIRLIKLGTNLTWKGLVDVLLLGMITVICYFVILLTIFLFGATTSMEGTLS